MDSRGKPYAAQLAELTSYIDSRPPNPCPTDWLRKGKGATASKPVPITKRYQPNRTGLDYTARFEDQESHASALPITHSRAYSNTSVAECLVLERPQLQTGVTPEVRKNVVTENQPHKFTVLFPGYAVDENKVALQTSSKKPASINPGNPTNAPTHNRLFSSDGSAEIPKRSRRKVPIESRNVNIITGALME